MSKAKPKRPQVATKDELLVQILEILIDDMAQCEGSDGYYDTNLEQLRARELLSILKIGE